MASTEPDRFVSKFKKDVPSVSNTTASRPIGTNLRRRVFENAVNETSNSSTSTSIKPRSTVSSSEGVTNRVGFSRFSNQNTSATISPSKQADDEPSIKDRTNKISVKDEDSDKNEVQETLSLKAKVTSLEKNDKERGISSVGSSFKRKQRKDLLVKRKPTGVVIMPQQPNVARDEEERIVMENTARNMQDYSGVDGGGSGEDREELLKQIEKYEQAIEDWKDNLAQAKREIETLRNENTRLKDENSALLRVVGSLSHGGRK
ncbi:protein phosphatase 1 regulatory subunit 12A isoform X3 [Hydra vulgaris]|uniref:Protein phosphatase 1 regulatory subunit 12A isoform X3 n=1 Tax=Hydra vulgaris TaxID=6087 RepID=A0ABM4CZS6_HYDVU